MERDERDTNRAFSALRIPEDAMVVDSTNLEKEQTVAIMQQRIDEYLETGEETHNDE